MSKQISKLLTICIFGESCISELRDCIKHAAELTQNIFFVDSGLAHDDKAKVKELGAQIIDLDFFKYDLDTDWILFIKPGERPHIHSENGLQDLLSDQNAESYMVIAKSFVESSDLSGFQWIRRLGQYSNVQNSLYLNTLQLRLVRAIHAFNCSQMLLQNTNLEDIHIRASVMDVLTLEPLYGTKDYESSKKEDHDIKCLKGEISYEIGKDDCIWELTTGYISHSVLHKGFLKSFMEGARLGFGGDRMYLAMLNYLTKFGHFNEAKEFYETWNANRIGEDNLELLKTGGIIYANLLLIDQAISCFEKAAKIERCQDILSNLGQLYLVKGDKEKTLMYLKETVEKESIPLSHRITDVVEQENWKPAKLTLCMIAKDEEKYIERALKSVEKIVDEIIVVDTGSRDETREVARKYGAKVIKTKWDNDFSAAKNLALSEASGDYILFMDADEFIEARHRYPLSILKAILPPSRDFAFKVRVEAEEEEEELSVQLRVPVWNKTLFQNRLIPNHCKIQFKGRAFEDVDESLRNLGIKVAVDDIFNITHGVSETKWRAERKRKAVLDSYSQITKPEYFFEGALYFLKLEDFDNAYVWLTKSNFNSPEIVAKIAILYLKNNQSERAKTIAQRGLQIWHENLELIYVLSEIYFTERQFEKTIKLLKNRINGIENQMDADLVAKAFYYYGMSLIETGSIAGGVDSLASAIEKEPVNTQYQMAGIYAFSKAGCWEEVIKLIGDILTDAGIVVKSKVNDFNEVASLLVELQGAFLDSSKDIEAAFCRKIIEQILRNQNGKALDIENLCEMIERR